MIVDPLMTVFPHSIVLNEKQVLYITLGDTKTVYFVSLPGGGESKKTKKGN